MFNNDKYQQQFVAKLQKVVPDQIVAVGMLGTPGSAQASAVSMASPLAARIMRAQNKKHGPDLPRDILAGVSATHLYLAGYKYGMGGMKIKGEPIVWPRAAFTVAHVGTGALANDIQFTFADGTGVILEATTGMGMNPEFNAPLMRELFTPARPVVQVDVQPPSMQA